AVRRRALAHAQVAAVSTDHGHTAALDREFVDPPLHVLAVRVREEHRDAVNALWQRIADRCEDRSITPGCVTSKRELGPLVSAALDGRPIPQLPVNTGWRSELLGPIVQPESLVQPQA
ncbi:MAG: hypothetical protein ACPGYV_08930, partial [Phycisphaeraceae bacterium]